MTISELLSSASVLGFLGILAKLVVDWARKRRMDAAESDVAEGSVASTLAERNLSALDAQIVVLEKANGLERASYERRIQALESDVARLTTERNGLINSVDALRSQMAEMQRRMDSMKTELDALPRRPMPSA